MRDYLLQLMSASLDPRTLRRVEMSVETDPDRHLQTTSHLFAFFRKFGPALTNLRWDASCLHFAECPAAGEFFNPDASSCAYVLTLSTAHGLILALCTSLDHIHFTIKDRYFLQDQGGIGQSIVPAFPECLIRFLPRALQVITVTVLITDTDTLESDIICAWAQTSRLRSLEKLLLQREEPPELRVSMVRLDVDQDDQPFGGWDDWQSKLVDYLPQLHARGLLQFSEATTWLNPSLHCCQPRCSQRS